MMGYQAAGSAPIVMGHPIENPETIATAIRIGNPASWSGATTARDESGGTIDMVTDDEMTLAQQWMAASDGVFCEPASAASVAGVIKHHSTHPFSGGETVVSVLTGHGLKDPNRAIEISDRPLLVGNTKDAVVSALAALLEK